MGDPVADYFVNGNEYPPAQCSEVPRPKCCGSCAFLAGPESVRPASMSIADVEIATILLDDFICHEPSEDGLYHTCAGWSARNLAGWA